MRPSSKEPLQFGTECGVRNPEGQHEREEQGLLIAWLEEQALCRSSRSVLRIRRTCHVFDIAKDPPPPGTRDEPPRDQVT